MTNKSLKAKFVIIYALSMTIFVTAIVAIVFFWSYFQFSNTFEDNTIDEHTTQEYLDTGIKNEWILGVSTHSIDIVEAIHNETTANHILKKAQKQVKKSQYYREEIDGKYLFYNIKLDLKNGEYLYKYSVIKDIYFEKFPNLLSGVIIFAIFTFIIFIFIITKISNHLTLNIKKTSSYLNSVANNNLEIEISNADPNEPEFNELVNSFCNMRNKLAAQNELQESMLQYISHELKTPLMIINSYSQSAKDEIFPKGDLNSTLDTISSQTERMEKKINELLLITKIDSNYFSKDNIIINVNQTIDNILLNFSNLLKNKKIHILIKNNLSLLCDSNSFQILIENLIINQIRYSNQNIYIRGFETKDNINLLFFNDGEKIANEYKNSIFLPFVKGHSNGHGLGLSICKKIATLHSGDIKLVDTTYGCLFEVILPKI